MAELLSMNIGFAPREPVIVGKRCYVIEDAFAKNNAAFRACRFERFQLKEVK
jgi:hypothetical protein